MGRDATTCLLLEPLIVINQDSARAVPDARVLQRILGYMGNRKRLQQSTAYVGITQGKIYPWLFYTQT